MLNVKNKHIKLYTGLVKDLQNDELNQYISLSMSCKPALTLFIYALGTEKLNLCKCKLNSKKTLKSSKVCIRYSTLFFSFY